jgi:hypothetical protein
LVLLAGLRFTVLRLTGFGVAAFFPCGLGLGSCITLNSRRSPVDFFLGLRMVCSSFTGVRVEEEALARAALPAMASSGGTVL